MRKFEHFVCRHCNADWDLSDAVVKPGDYIDGHLVSSYMVCPECGSEDWCEAVQCPECGGWFNMDETYQDYCENCIKEFATPESLISYCEDETETEEIEINFAVKSILNTLGVDINKLLMSYALKKAKAIEYEDRLKAAAEISVKVELDTEYYMKYEHNRRAATI